MPCVTNGGAEGTSQIANIFENICDKICDITNFIANILDEICDKIRDITTFVLWELELPSDAHN